MTRIDVVNVIPKVRGDETLQDSEPSIAVNPQNPRQIVITAFTPADPGLINSPIYFSADGGFTWTANFTMPFGPPPPPGSQFPKDQSVAYAADSSEMYGAFMRGDTGNLQVFRTADPSSSAVLGVFGNLANIDQPWVDARC